MTGGVGYSIDVRNENSSDDGWTGSKDFWNAYKNDPDRLEHKQAQKKKREEEQEVARRQKHMLQENNPARVQQLERTIEHLTWSEADAKRRAQISEVHSRDLSHLYEKAAQRIDTLENDARSMEAELAYMQKPACNDWLLHNGNVTYARDRSSFKTYTPIKATAVMNDGKRNVSVIGVGSVRAQFKRQLGQSQEKDITIDGVLHVPAMRCNGLSIGRLEKGGFMLKQRQDDRFVVFNVKTNASFFCGNGSCGKLRICFSGERDDIEARPHLLQHSIGINVDRQHIASLATGSGFLP